MRVKATTLFTEIQASKHLGLSQQELQYRRRKQLPPKFFTTNGRVYYNLEELNIPVEPLKRISHISFTNLRDKIRKLSRLEFESFSLEEVTEM